LPAAAGFIALGRPIVRLLLQHGVFRGASTDLFASTLVLMAVGLGGFSAFQQETRAFYARQDTRTPYVVNIWGTAFQIVTSFPFYVWLGVPGLALSWALSYVLAAVIGVVVLRRQLGGIDGTRLVVSHTRIAIASAITGAVAWGIARAIGSAVNTSSFAGEVAQVFGAIAAGLGVYVGLSYVMHLEELRPLTRILGGRFLGRAS